MKKSFILVGILACSSQLNAQCSFSGLPLNICESGQPVTLTGSGSGIFSGPGITGNVFDPVAAGPGIHTINYDEYDPNVYTVYQGGTFSPIPSTGTLISLSDDQLSSALPIGFNFNFFGTTYTNFYISSNGFITFSASTYNGCCSGSIIPSADGVDNIIAWSWNDLYPPGSGTIRYETIGTAPNRKLLVTFTDQWHCCSGPDVNTGQIILYETTNIIEIHDTEITNDGSTCTQGIENAAGTVAYYDANKNSTLWTTTNDYIAFIPESCNFSQLVQVIANPQVEGTATPNPVCAGDQVTLTGSGADSYSWSQGVTDGVPFNISASGSYIVSGTDASTGCVGTDVVDVVYAQNPTISLSPNDVMFGNDGSINLTITNGTPPYQFDWSNDGTGDNNDAQNLTGVTAGSYTVIMTDGNGCSVTASATVGSQLGMEELEGTSLLLYPNPSHGEFTVETGDMTDDMQVHLLVVDTYGRQIHAQVLDTDKTTIDISSQEPGMYFVKIISEKGTTVSAIILQ